jgi:xanthine dehydrogenase accessory factor
VNVDDRIVAAIEEWSAQGVDFALATVVGVRGSTYRGLAARQLISEGRADVGTVSGGCLDDDLHQVAAEVIATGKRRLVEFDLTADDEAIWGWGIGCNGATELLVEPAAGARQWAEVFRRRPRVRAVLHPLGGDGLGDHLPVVEGDPVWGEAVEGAIASGRHQRHQLDDISYLLEVVVGPPRLVICGAGHDAVPMVRFGAALGYRVTIMDDRHHLLTNQRFPEAAELVLGSPDQVAELVDVDRGSSAVIMTHNYLRDLEYLKALLKTPVTYIGCLGPGARLERLLADLEGEGVLAGEADLARLHGPAGLDIGAEGPEEIAWSVMAEIMASRRGREGGQLRHRKGPAAYRR